MSERERSLERETRGTWDKKRGGPEALKRKLEELDRISTSFFFTDFPDSCSMSDLW